MLTLKTTSSSDKPLSNFIVEIDNGIVYRITYLTNVREKIDENNTSWEYDYSMLNVNFELKYELLYPALIHLIYTVDDEYHILDEKDNDVERYESYMKYKEECKTFAKELCNKL